MKENSPEIQVEEPKTIEQKEGQTQKKKQIRKSVDPEYDGCGMIVLFILAIMLVGFSLCTLTGPFL